MEHCNTIYSILVIYSSESHKTNDLIIYNFNFLALKTKEKVTYTNNTKHNKTKEIVQSVKLGVRTSI